MLTPVTIPSLMDTDLYKLTMGQAIFTKYPDAITKWRFKDRSDTIIPEGVDPMEFIAALNTSIDRLCELRFQPDELEYLRNFTTKSGNRLFKEGYIEFLRNFQLNREYIKVTLKKGKLDITIKGPWVSVTMFEVPVLAIVAELYGKEAALREGPTAAERLENKIKYLQEKYFAGELKGFKFADFGTRRRFSFAWQEYVVKTLTETLPKDVFFGTSNVYLAKKYNLTPIGTMAHEWLQAHQQLGPRVVDSQKVALDVWAQVYRGELGIALSDVVGFDAFLRDFDLFFAKLFDGARHDSGDPFEWGDKLIAHYEKLKVDSKTKSAVFSDSLDFEKAVKLFHYFKDRINVSFGIGTFLTNDTNYKAPNIVLKMVELNGQPVAKISDSKGKGMCEDPAFERYVREVFRIKE